MYRLVLYGLFVIALMAIGFAFSGILPFNGWYMLLSLLVLLMACMWTNILLGYLFKVPLNVESCYITALILFLIFPPATTLLAYVVLVLIAILAMSSKFILNIRGKHVFNPAAIAALLVGFAGLVLPTWWVGSSIMLPIVAVVGLLIVRKIHRFDLFITFLFVSLSAIVITNIIYGEEFFNSIRLAFSSWPIIFFGSVMLTEPSTMPPTFKSRLTYGVLVGLLFGVSFHIGKIYSTPELALVVGNIFAYIVSPKQKLILKLKEKLQLAPSVYDFVFVPDKQFAFTAGQYMEWTLGHNPSDTRGNRRYFTIASAPTEKEIHLGVKIPVDSSSFKKALVSLNPGDEVVAGTLSGEFNLPKDVSKKVVGIAGGVGITPFRSMIKNMVDKKEQRDFILFYLSADPSEFVYKDIFESAKQIGVKTIYILSVPNGAPIPSDWNGKTGYITKEMITQEIPDFIDREYYISGPPAMVEVYKKLLVSTLGVSRTAIKTDYFPGY